MEDEDIFSRYDPESQVHEKIMHYTRIALFSLQVAETQGCFDEIWSNAQQRTYTALAKMDIDCVNLRSIAFSCAKYAHLDFVRKSYRQQNLLDRHQENLIEEIERVDNQDTLEIEALLDCINQLPAREANLISERYFDKQPINELAEKTELSIHQINRLISSTKQNLRKCIEKKLKD